MPSTTKRDAPSSSIDEFTTTPRAKRSKKDAKSAPPKERAYFDSAFSHAGVKLPTPIKIEREDNTQGQAREQKSTKGSKKDTPPKSPRKAAGQAASTVSHDSGEGQPKAKHVGKKADKKCLVVDLGSSDDDEKEDVQEDRNEDIEPAGVARRKTKASVPSATSTSPKKTRRKLTTEADIYLHNLIHLPITSGVIPSALESMVFQWFDSKPNLAAFQGGHHRSWIIEQLTNRSAPETRINELSKPLEEADLKQHCVKWLRQRVPDHAWLRDVCALLIDDLDKEASGKVHRSSLPSSRPLAIEERRDPPAVVQRDVPSYPARPHHSSYSGHASSSRADNPAAPPRHPSSWEAGGRSSRSHGTGRPPATSIPYMRTSDARKVLLFIVGTPDTALTDADYDAYHFRSAGNKAFGAAHIESVGLLTANTWRITFFKPLLPGFRHTPITYRNVILFPDEALSCPPDCFVASFTELELPAWVILSCIADFFGTRPGIVYRLELGSQKYILVLFKYPPDLLRFYVPMPRRDVLDFMPAFKPLRHVGGVCSLCRERHAGAENVCASAVPLT